MSHLSATSGTQPNRRSAPSPQNRKSPRKRGLKGSRFPEGSIGTELATPVKDRADSRAYRPRAAALGGAYPAIAKRSEVQIDRYLGGGAGVTLRERVTPRAVRVIGGVARRRDGDVQTERHANVCEVVHVVPRFEGCG